MLDNFLIPHDAIQAFADGRPQPKKRDRVQPLFSLKETAEILGMPEGRIEELVRTKKLFALKHKDQTTVHE
jgi:hypothetical protein